MGSSIIEKARLQLTKMASMYNFEVISLCRAGKFLKFFHGQDLKRYLAPLDRATSDDILYISFFGNELFNKSKHEKDDSKNFHLKKPSVLSGEQFNILIADTAHLIKAVKSRFAGSIYVLGPTPRHLAVCCSEDTHKIKDEIGVEVDTLKYVNTFSNQLKRNIILPAGASFIDYRQIFGATFSPDSLADHVHLKEGACKRLANFMIRGEEVLLAAPEDTTAADYSFTEALSAVDIVSRDMTPDSSEEDKNHKGYNFDDLDYEHND